MSGIQREQYREILHTLATSAFTTTVLEAALDLDVFSKLQGRSATIEETAALWGMAPPSARAIAQYLCFLGLLTYSGGKLSNAPLVETQLVGDPLTREMIHSACRQQRHTADDLKEKLLHPMPLNWYQMRDEGRKPEETDLPEDFYERFDEVRVRSGEDLALQYDFAEHSCLMDVGGASGGWCLGIRSRFPHLRCIVFDIPLACEVAERKFAEAGQTEYLTPIRGDFFSQDLPQTADVVLLANVLHDWTVEDDRRILRNVYQALPAGGVVLVRESFIQDDWTGKGSAIPAIQAFAVLGAQDKCGWQPTYCEMETLLKEEGFTRIECRHNLVVGQKVGILSKEDGS